ncbi:MAG: hypothetical protein NC417_06380 [Candidatus Gastranaerophilales bacterium]|nr:hypothetical protein [Candidatus Gastranaerophilales bacterium]
MRKKASVQKAIVGLLARCGLELFALLLCATVLCIGISQKEGYHMDELLSFELANAKFNPWIVPTQPEGRLAKFVRNEIDGDSIGETLANLGGVVADVLENGRESRLLTYTADVYAEPVWIDKDTFRDYITVGDGDAFQYLSVYFNVKDDNHPPLHFMLLHTMSSIFRGSAEPFVGCVINLAAVLGVMLLLMYVGRQLGGALLQGGSVPAGQGGRIVGVLAALVYGLSAGAMATVLLIRMYALLTFFCVALFALHVKKWRKKEWESGNRLLIAVTVLGFWTQYFFLFYCLALAAVTAALLVAEKKYKALFGYVRSMALAAAIGLVGFPFAISDVFSSGRGVEALQNLSEGLSGYGVRLTAFLQILAERTAGKTGLVVLALVLAAYLIGRRYRKYHGQKALLCMLFLPPVVYFFLAGRMSPYLVDRYIMPIFPFVAIAAALAVCGLTDLLGGRKAGYGAVCAVLLLWQVHSLWPYSGDYLYIGYEAQRGLAREYANYPCICVYDGVGYYENLLEFAEYDRTLLVTQAELAQREDQDSVRGLKNVVVLIKQGVDLALTMDTLQDIYGLSLGEWLSVNRVHGDRIGLFTGK